MAAQNYPPVLGLPSHELDHAAHRDDCGESTGVTEWLMPKTGRHHVQCSSTTVQHGFWQEGCPLLSGKDPSQAPLPPPTAPGAARPAHRAAGGPACGIHTASSSRRMSGRQEKAGTHQPGSGAPGSSASLPLPPALLDPSLGLGMPSSFLGLSVPDIAPLRSTHPDPDSGGETVGTPALQTLTSFTTFLSEVFMSSLLETCSISSGGKT